MTATPRQSKLQGNAEATERWMRKLLRAAHELEKLRAQRKRSSAWPAAAPSSTTNCQGDHDRDRA